MSEAINIQQVMSLFATEGAAACNAQPGFAPGSRFYADLPADVYHADRDALSCSMLKPLLESPASFQASLVASARSSRQMDFGSLVHVLLLQPMLFSQEFAVYPGVADGRDKDYKRFLADNPERHVIDEATFSSGRRLAEKLLHRAVNGRPLGDYVAEGVPEASIYFQEPTTGLSLRVRLDLYHPELSLDLKTTRHGTKNGFIRDALDMSYDMQAFMYSLGRSLYEGKKAVPFVFIAAQSDEPHSIFKIDAGESFLDNGAKKFQEVITTYVACTKNNYWPDASCDDVAEITEWQAFTSKADWKQGLSQTS